MSEALYVLPEKYDALRAEARELTGRVASLTVSGPPEHGFNPDVRRLLRESGLAAVMVPGAFGGRFENVDSLAVTVVREVLAGESGHLDSMFAMQGIGSFALTRAGSLDLQHEWLPRIARL